MFNFAMKLAPAAMLATLSNALITRFPIEEFGEGARPD